MNLAMRLLSAISGLGLLTFLTIIFALLTGLALREIPPGSLSIRSI